MIYIVLSMERLNNTMDLINVGLEDIDYWIQLAQDRDRW
jgi:hypothetical protein